MNLAKFNYSGESGVLVDAYLRAKSMVKIESLPTQHSTSEKANIYGMMPLALMKSSVDYIRGQKTGRTFQSCF